MQDLMDEIFIYSHTPKEPANTFHENLKAIGTIQKFMDIYDSMKSHRKTGDFVKKKEVFDFCKSGQVGFSKKILEEATEIYFKERNFDTIQAMEAATTEPLSVLTSTKAVIKDERGTFKPLVKAVIQSKQWASRMGRFEEFQELYKKKIKESVLKGEKPRHKVHDLLIPLSLKFKTVYEAALNYCITSGKVIADICIKAQYGAKREFYVMNMGAKLMSRVCETFCREICKQSTNEMISVPGDRKFFYIQDMLGRSTTHSIKNDSHLMFVNGDCTKWSASETMEALGCVLKGASKGLPEKFRNFLLEVMYLWTKKEVHVPSEIVSKVLSMGNGSKLQPEQNFLQGVFNYLSSLKSDIAHNYVAHLWKEFYPNEEVYFEYLVHSDDYVLSVCTKDIQTFEKFRALHKLVLKMCGITDSSKKTNCQYIFMEFISLFGFNGSMCYPNIKKTKECTTTLPSEGFQSDSDFVCSRTAECVRVGVPCDAAYIFHRMHMGVLRRSYSLDWIDNKYDMPVEFFGQSDMHPIFYLLCKGDQNNYRLWSNGGSFLLKQVHHFAMKYPSVGDEYAGRFRPMFLYNRYNTNIRLLRKSSGLSPKDALEFWKEYPSYSFTKPSHSSDLNKWLRAKYFVNSFVKAYNKDTRTIRTLRLSMFSSAKCMTLMTHEEMINFYNRITPIRDSMKTTEWIENTYTLRELYEVFLKAPKTESKDEEILTYIFNGDSTVKTIYDLFENTELTFKDKEYLGNTIACYVPPRPKWIPISTPNNILLQYMDSKKLALLNNPFYKKWDRVEEDVRTITNDYTLIKNNFHKNKSETIGLLARMLDNNLSKRTVCVSINRERLDLLRFIKAHLSVLGMSLNRIEFLGKHLTKVYDPFIGSTHVMMGWNPAQHELKLVASEICLALSLLHLRTTMSKDYILKIMAESLIGTEKGMSSVLDYIKNLRYEEVENAPLTRTDKQNIAFLKMYITNSPEFVINLLNKDMFCSYGWDNSKEIVKDGKKSGKVHIYIKFQNTVSKFTRNWDTNKSFLTSDTTSTTKALCVYNIALALIGDQSMMYLEANFYKKPSPSHTVSLSPLKKGLYIDSNYKVKTLMPNEKRTVYPIKIGTNVRWRGNYKHYNYTLINNIKVKDMSIYNGNFKVYTLQFNSLYDNDLIEYPEIEYKGLNLKGILESKAKKDLLNMSGSLDISKYKIEDYVEKEPPKLPELFDENKSAIPLISDVNPSDSMGLFDFEIDFNDIEIMDWDGPNIDLEENYEMIEASSKLSNISVEKIELNYNNKKPFSVIQKEKMPDLALQAEIDKIKAPQTMSPVTSACWLLCAKKLKELGRYSESHALLMSVNRAVKTTVREPVNGHSFHWTGSELRLYKVHNIMVRDKDDEEKVVAAMQKGVMVFLEGKRINDISNYRGMIQCDVPREEINSELELYISKNSKFPPRFLSLFEDNIGMITGF
jgi:hypothetical protein